MASRVQLDVDLNDKVAHAPQVSRDIIRRGKQRQAASEARHAVHRDQGHSKVEGFFGDADYNIVLDDSRGYGAAFSIEFGTTGSSARDIDEDGTWQARGTTPTHTLTGVPYSIGGGDIGTE